MKKRQVKKILNNDNMWDIWVSPTGEEIQVPHNGKDLYLFYKASIQAQDNRYEEWKEEVINKLNKIHQ